MAKNWTIDNTASERARERHVTARLRNVPETLTGFGERMCCKVLNRAEAVLCLDAVMLRSFQIAV